MPPLLAIRRKMLIHRSKIPLRWFGNISMSISTYFMVLGLRTKDLESLKDRFPSNLYFLVYRWFERIGLRWGSYYYVTCSNATRSIFEEEVDREEF